MRPIRSSVQGFSVRAASRSGRHLAILAGCLLMLGSASSAVQAAGSIFLTGHDPDYHAYLGGNAAGAQRINQVAIGFVQDPGLNPYVAGAPMFLFVESSISPPPGHVDGINGLIASGYVAGVNFEVHDASTLGTELNLLGTKYSAIVVGSDHGGILTQAELNILNARQVDIVNFVNSGGGLYAMAESNAGAGLTPGGGQFAFAPIAVAAPSAQQPENGYSVTPFGAALGLTNADVNGNFSHNVFTTYGGLNPVDLDPQGQVVTVAGHEQLVGVQWTNWGDVKLRFK
jgi:hypothetical protein